MGLDGQNESKFIVNPFTNVAWDRMYRTGDLGRYMPVRKEQRKREECDLSGRTERRKRKEDLVMTNDDVISLLLLSPSSGRQRGVYGPR
jgi:hypothetical protein